MIRSAALPPEFHELQGKVFHIQKVSNNEYSSSCPECGGVPHQNGDLPDRFRMLRKNRRGNPMGFCRKCNYTFIPTDDRYTSQSPAHIRPEDRKPVLPTEEELSAVERFKKNNKALQYYQQMPIEGRMAWYERGVTDAIIDYYKLGWMDHYPITDKETGEKLVTDALTIPCYDEQWNITQIYYRLMKSDVKGKYRQTRGIIPSLFIADPDEPLTGNVILLEGQIKAIVTMDMIMNVGGEKYNPYLGKMFDLNVCAMPTCWPTDITLYPLRNAKKIFINLDPDIYENENGEKIFEKAIEILRVMFGRELYELQLWGKIDDMLLDGSLTAESLLDMLGTCNRL